MAAADSVPQSYPDDPDLPRPGDVIASKYRIEGVLGTGGMGVVLSARHVQLGQSVAIKLLTTGLGDERREEAVARFLREGQAAAGLQTDHVVRVYDVGTLDNGSPFMVMELLRGSDLGQVLDNNGRLPIPDAVEYVLQACDAIEHAHAQGIVHRDLKPSNLFMTTRSDGTPHVKVLDFGISKALHGEAELRGSLTSTRSVLGSPFYMSPEQLRDAKTIDHRTDIWALGVILHELLSGAPAFEGETLPGVAAAIAADPPARIQTLRPEVPTGLQDCILRCLEKSPSQRYQSVRELIEALTPYGLRPHRSKSVRLITVNEGPPTVTLNTSPSRRAMAEAQTIQLSAADGVPATSADWKSTLPSNAPPHAGAISQSGERSIPGGPAWDTGTASGHPAAGRSKKNLVLLGVLVSMLTVGVLYVLSTRRAADVPERESVKPAPQSTSITPSAPLTFKLILESSPSGAEVKEGEKSLGFTPLQSSIQRSELRGQTRTFTLSKPGFLPYTLIQSDSESDVRVVAALVPEPTKPAASAPPTVSTSVATLRNSSPRAAKPPEPAKQKPVPVPPSDIRMQR